SRPTSLALHPRSVNETPASPCADRGRERQIVSAVPNLLTFEIEAALEKPNPTAESVAAVVAASSPFLEAIRRAMGVDGPSAGWATAQIVQFRLAKAFAAGTANAMYPPLPKRG